MLHEKSDSSIGQIQCHLFGSFEDMKKSNVSNYWHLTLSILVVLDDGIWNFISISLILHEIFIWWTSFHFHIYTCTTIRVAERKMITSNCVYVDDLVFSILSKNIRFFFSSGSKYNSVLRCEEAHILFKSCHKADWRKMNST